ncbi:MAG: radical SAM protein, partial [Candidatus Omnitrophota bacterium]
VIPAVTPLLTADKLAELKEAGVDQLALSLDAADAHTHDDFRKTPGVFDRTLEAVRQARQIGLAVQINSLVNVHNLDRFDALIGLVEELPIVFWEIFFLVPTGRGKDLPMLEAQLFDEAFARIYALQQRAHFVIKVTEAMHYRKYCLDREPACAQEPPTLAPQMPAMLRRQSGPGGSIGHAPMGVNSGKGFVFVSCTGEIMPSGFLPLPAGNIKIDDLGNIYRNAPLFKALRDTSLLKGKCGICSYKDLCGGSRSRAWALTGDYLAADPCCSYQPPTA